MTNERGRNGGKDDPLGLDETIAAYIDRLAAGESIDPLQVLTDHPGIGHEILASIERFIDPEGERSDAPALSRLGDYTLLRRIGRGGMGVVYEAHQGSMDRRVALKVLPAGAAADRKAFVRFLREAQTAGKLRHPSIVSVYGMGVEADTPYYAMEFVDGKTLAEVIRDRREGKPDRSPAPFGSTEIDLGYYAGIAKAFAEVADGLQHAHREGVIHRDIKPSNLMVDLGGRIRVVDFGLAHLGEFGSLTRSADLIGTPLYMSPEQARQRAVPIDHRTDIYSLGATLYEVLTLRPPFRGKDYRDTLSQIIALDPPSPRRLDPRIPRDLETIALKCLRKDPADRYGTAEALALDLRGFARGDPIEARPQTGWERFGRRLKRRWRSIVIVAVLLLLGAGSIWLAERGRRAEIERRRAEYRATVFDAAVKLASGRLILEAASASGTPSILLPGIEFAALGPVTAEDLRRINEDGSLRPVHDAARSLETLAAGLPGERDAHFHLARAFLLLGEARRAIEELDRTIAIDPGFAPAEVLRREIEARRADPSEGDHGQDRSIAAEPGTWTGLWVEARDAARRLDWTAAAAAHDRLIADHCRGDEPYIGFQIEAYIGRGAARIMLEDYDGAQEDFAVARFLAPDAIEPDLLLGKAYHLEGKGDLARKHFERLLEGAWTRREETRLWIVSVYSSLREFREALAWTSGLANPPLRDRLRSYLLLRIRDAPGAIEAARAAVEAEPESASAHLLLASALRWILFDDRDQQHETMLEFLRAAERCTELAHESWQAGGLLQVAQAIARRYLARFQRRNEMDARRTSMAAILAATLTGGIARPACVFDDFVVNPDPFDCDPVCWEPAPWCGCGFQPNAEGLDMWTTGSYDASIGMQDVFAGETAILVQGSFNGTQKGPSPITGGVASIIAGLDMDAVTGCGYAGYVFLDGRLSIYKFIFTDWSTQRWGRVNFAIGPYERLALELRAGKSPGLPQVEVELRVWRPEKEERPADAQVTFIDEANFYTNGIAGFGAFVAGGRPIRFYSVRISNPPCEVPFIRGDADGDGKGMLNDPIFALNYLFASGPAPTCLDAADANDDGSVNIADPVAVLYYLFGMGSPPPAPFPACGADPTEDEVPCEEYAGCR